MPDRAEKPPLPSTLLQHCGKQMCRGLEMVMWIRGADAEGKKALEDLLVMRMSGQKTN
jgi:hypothetical protein